MRSNKLLIKFSVIFIGAFLGLFILEVSLHFYTIKDLWGLSRIAMGERLTDCQVKDARLHHKLIRSCVGVLKAKEYETEIATNSFGFRDDDIRAKDSKIFRVLIVGDSFAEGWGVEITERFDTIAEKILDDAMGGDKVDIINTGTRSYSPILELEFLKENVGKLKPDLVIAFFDLSDLHDDYYYGGWKRYFRMKEDLGFGTDTFVEVWPPPEPPLTTFLLKSRLFQVVHSEVGTEILNRRKKLTRTNLSWDISLFAKANDWENFDKSWNLNIANLNLIGDFLKTKSIDYAVTVVPRGNYIDAKEWDSGREALGIERQKLYEPRPIDTIMEELGKSGIATLELYNPLRQSNVFPLYYPFYSALSQEIIPLIFNIP